jgi:hypothetical protein
MTKPDGTYELPIYRPGHYRVGVNLNQSAKRDAPYPRWFYPGTADEAAAAEIEFNGKPETRVLDIALPQPMAARVVAGVVFGRDGQPRPRALVTAFDASQAIIAQTSTDPNGRFTVHLFADTPYTLEAEWGGMAPDAVSAVPIQIQPGRNTLDLEVVLTEPGNSTLKRLQQRGMR